MGRLIIISNRLPFSLDKDGDKVSLRQSSGGLVSAIKSYFENTTAQRGDLTEKMWMGVADFPQEDWDQAVAAHADALVFLTDVPGVRGADGQVMRWLSVDQIAPLTRDAVISGGMLPKLGACREALLHGVKRVRILPAEEASSMRGPGSIHP